MELDLSIHLFVAAAYFLAGLVDAVSGGGGLLSIPVLMLAGVPVHSIAGTNQCSIVCGATVAAGRFARRGKVRWGPALMAAAMAALGSNLGARLNLFLPERYLQIVMIVLVPLVALVLLGNKQFGQKDRSGELSAGRQLFRSGVIGLVCGAYLGFYGAGAGTFLILGFALLGRFDLITASGSAKVAGMAATYAAAVTYTLSGAVVWPLVVSGTVANLAGNYLGAGLALKKGARVIRPMFLVVLALLVVRLVVTLF